MATNTSGAAAGGGAPPNERGTPRTTHDPPVETPAVQGHDELYTGGATTTARPPPLHRPLASSRCSSRFINFISLQLIISLTTTYGDGIKDTGRK